MIPIARDRLAIVAADGVFSYFDLAQAAARIGAQLAGPGGHLREARVAYLVPPSFAHVVITRGIWLAGGVAVPLAVSHPPPELAHVVRDSGASIVIGSGRQAGALEEIAESTGAAFIRTADLIAGDAEVGDAAGPPTPTTQEPGSPASRALILYPSGTTGRPQGVVTTHAHIAAPLTPPPRPRGVWWGGGRAGRGGGWWGEILPKYETEPTWERLASGEITV